MSARYAFVVGTGRSGTHFLARVLGTHPRVTDPFGGEEDRALLLRATEAALDGRTRLPARNLWRYRRAGLKARGLTYLDQHHPNLFFVPDIARRLRGARFVALWRDDVAVVASMLNHEGARDAGVRVWFETAARRPWPNPFLGPVDLATFEAMSLVEKCALRAVAHKTAMHRLRGREDVRIQPFDALVADVEGAAAAIFAHLGLPFAPTGVRADPATLTKWRDTLNDDEAAAVRAVAARYGEYDEP